MRARSRQSRAEERTRAATARGPGAADAILSLQRTAGNRAVGYLLRRPKIVTVTGGGLGNDAEFEADGGDERVKGWQRSLNATEPGIPEHLIVDGIFGPKSQTAMRLSQWRRGEPITGQMPPGTIVETQGGGL